MLYSLTGKVIHGKSLGHKHGMPTANIALKDSSVKHGVYAGVINVRGQAHYCVTNVGPRPSIDNDPTDKVESYILDFSEDIYDEEIKLDLYYYLRDIRKFRDIDEVVKQVNSDIEKAGTLLKETIKL